MIYQSKELFLNINCKCEMLTICSYEDAVTVDRRHAFYEIIYSGFPLYGNILIDPKES